MCMSLFVGFFFLGVCVEGGGRGGVSAAAAAAGGPDAVGRARRPDA
jgi:hypothetical protein